MTIEIPEILIQYPEDAPIRWQEIVNRWWNSPRDNFSVWEEYAPLMMSGRYGIPSLAQMSYAFSETFAGLTLERRGLTCYRSAKLFSRRGRQVGEMQRKRNTDAVKGRFELMGLPWPRTVQSHFSATLKNPDITAFGPGALDVQFCEVKRGHERGLQFQAQLDGLGALHLITGAPVAILRLVREGSGSKASPLNYTAAFNYTGPALVHLRSKD